MGAGVVSAMVLLPSLRKPLEEPDNLAQAHNLYQPDFGMVIACTIEPPRREVAE